MFGNLPIFPVAWYAVRSKCMRVRICLGCMYLLPFFRVVGTAPGELQAKGDVLPDAGHHLRGRGQREG